MSIWNDAVLEEQRNLRREKPGRITFDCFNLKSRGDRAYCSKGYLLGRAKDGSLDLVSVLRGVTSGVCRVCKDFDGGDEELLGETTYPEPLHTYEKPNPPPIDTRLADRHI